MAKLEVRLFGRFAVISEKGPIELNTRPAQLLAYLALAGGRPVSRTRVAGALWPDLAEERARANLSTVMWRLQGALESGGHPSGVLVATVTSVGLDMRLCEVDVEEFRQGALRPGQPAVGLEQLSRTVHAIAYYRGDLLEDWDVEWCHLERENLKQCFVSSLVALAEGFGRRGRHDLAVGYARRAADADPFNEQAQRVLMRLFIRTGDKAAAASHLKRFTRLARSELGVEPDSETMALLAELKRPSRVGGLGDAPIPASLVIQPERAPLVGRSGERQVAAAIMDTALAGRGGGLLLVGEAGIGKSRFAEWVAEEWAARSGVTLRGRSIEFNEPVPYQPVLDALSVFVDADDVARFVVRDSGTLAVSALDDAMGYAGDTSPWPPGKLRLFNWLQAPLVESSRSRPTMVLIEDLQWADTGTVDFLVHLLERARQMRLVVLLTARPVGPRPVHDFNLERLSRHCRTVLHLGPLLEAETGELIRALVEGQHLPAYLVARIFAESEGNPLFVIETLRLLQQRRSGLAISRARHSSSTSLFESDLGVPDGVRNAVQQRLALLDPVARQVAEIASVLGRNFDEELLAMVSKGSRNSLSSSIECLLRHKIFERENAGYRFSHDKIRAVCYANLTAQMRRTCHVRAAAILAQWPDIPAHRLAWHQHSAGQWHLAARSWTMAGDQARNMYAYEEALLAYQNAAFCIRRDRTRDIDEGIPEEFLLLVKSDEVLEVLGRPQDRKPILDQMGALCQQSGAPALQAVWLTRCAIFEDHTGNFTRAAHLANRARIIARSVRSAQAEVEALRVLAWAKNRAGNHVGSLAVTKVLLGKLGGAPSLTKATALWQAAVAHIKLGDFTSALAFTGSARETLAALGYLDEVPMILMVEAMALKWTANSQQSRARLLKALKFARNVGDITTEARAMIHLATLDSLCLRIGDAIVRLRGASVKCQSAGYARARLSCLNEIANSVGRLIGNYRWAWDASRRALGMPITQGSRMLIAVCKDSQAQLHLDHYNVDAAAALVDEVLRLFELEGRQGDPYGPFLESFTKRGVIALLRKDYRQAVADLERARDIQTRLGERLMLPDTLSYLAMAYSELGDSDRALATSSEALRLLADIGHANLQPQRLFWHHFLILGKFGVEPRLGFLKRAVEFIDAQAATLSRAQQLRLRRDVPLNREILASWDRQGDTCELVARLRVP